MDRKRSRRKGVEKFQFSCGKTGRKLGLSRADRPGKLQANEGKQKPDVKTNAEIAKDLKLEWGVWQPSAYHGTWVGSFLNDRYRVWREYGEEGMFLLLRNDGLWIRSLPALPPKKEMIALIIEERLKG